MPARIDAADLPAAVRRRYGLTGRSLARRSGDGTVTQPAQKDADRPARPGRMQYRCHACQAVLPSWAAAERHVDSEHGTARLECILADGPARR